MTSLSDESLSTLAAASLKRAWHRHEQIKVSETLQLSLRSQVVRLTSQRAQVNIASAVERLTLRHQVEHLPLPGREALQQLAAQKREKGELTLENKRKLHSLWRKAEAEVLAAADVVCVTCIGAGDRRLRRLSFPCVCSCACVQPAVCVRLCAPDVGVKPTFCCPNKLHTPCCTRCFQAHGISSEVLERVGAGPDRRVHAGDRGGVLAAAASRRAASHTRGRPLPTRARGDEQGC